MNILAVNWQDLENPHAGGAELHLFELMSRLVLRGHRVHLVCSGWPGGAPTATVQGVTVERHGARYSFAALGRRAVKAALRGGPWDVVLEDINKLPLYLPTLTRLPVYAIIPHLFGTTAFQEASWPMAAMVAFAERPIPRAYRASAFHAISESTRDDLVARGIPTDQVRVIHPGIDCGSYTPASGLDRASPPTFLYVGRLKRYKGVDMAIRALARARERRPELTLDIAGTGDDASRLTALAASLGQAAAVRFHGFVTEARKRQLFRTASANLFPSPKEGWGLTVIEAGACGTPSLASDSPGLRDSVRDGVTGYLVRHGDADALAARMLELADQPALVERLGAQARAHACTWSWEDAASATEAHLQDFIAG